MVAFFGGIGLVAFVAVKICRRNRAVRNGPPEVVDEGTKAAVTAVEKVAANTGGTANIDTEEIEEKV